MKTITLTLLFIAMFLSGCEPASSQERKDWIAQNEGVLDKYFCQDGYMMHQYWSLNTLRQEMVSDYDYKYQKCSVKEKENVLPNY